MKKRTSKYHYSSQEKDDIFNNEFYPLEKYLLGFALSFTKDEDNAKDLVQDVFAIAFQKIAYYERNTFAKSWLCRLMRNHFINKQKERHNSVHKEDIDNPIIENLPQFVYEQHDKTSEIELSDSTKELLMQLDDKERKPLMMHYLAGFSYEEIGAILGVKVNTIRTQINRAKNIVQELKHKQERTYMNTCKFCEKEDMCCKMGIKERFEKVYSSECFLLIHIRQLLLNYEDNVSTDALHKAAYSNIGMQKVWVFYLHDDADILDYQQGNTSSQQELAVFVTYYKNQQTTENIQLLFDEGHSRTLSIPELERFYEYLKTLFQSNEYTHNR